MEPFRGFYRNSFQVIEKELNKHISIIKGELKSEFIFIRCGINAEDLEKSKFQKHLNWVIKKKNHNDLTIMINSTGGDPEEVYKLVPLIRENFKFVRYIVNDIALSAATLLCLSGDEIYISNSSKMGDLRLQLSKGKYSYPFIAYYEDNYDSIEKEIRFTDDMRNFIALFKASLEIDSNIKIQNEIKEAALSYLKTYMFKEYELLTREEKEKVDGIPEKLTNSEFLLGMGCITHDTGIYYSKLKNDIGLKIINYRNDFKNNKLSDAIIDFADLVNNYCQLSENGFDNKFAYSEHVDSILNR